MTDELQDQPTPVHQSPDPLPPGLPSSEEAIKALTDDELRMWQVSAMQRISSGVAALMEKGQPVCTGKHLRTGLDAVNAQHTAIINLLINKGVITAREVQEQVLVALIVDGDCYEREVQEVWADDRIRLGWAPHDNVPGVVDAQQ